MSIKVNTSCQLLKNIKRKWPNSAQSIHSSNAILWNASQKLSFTSTARGFYWKRCQFFLHCWRSHIKLHVQGKLRRQYEEKRQSRRTQVQVWGTLGNTGVRRAYKCRCETRIQVQVWGMHTSTGVRHAYKYRCEACIELQVWGRFGGTVLRHRHKYRRDARLEIQVWGVHTSAGVRHA
jgi:hypothetical protein